MLLTPGAVALILANLVASVYGISFNRGFVGAYAFNIAAIAQARQHYRIFTSSFLHGDYFHLLFNMLTLFYFGPHVERLLGTDGFFVVYFGAVMASGIAAYYLFRNNPGYTSIGASDGVSGVLIAFCVFHPFEPIYFMFVPIPIPAILYGVFFIALSAGMMGRGGRISHEAHLAGALAGAALTVLMRPDALTRLFA